MNTHHVTLRDKSSHGDKSRGKVVTLIVDPLTKSKPTDSLRLADQAHEENETAQIPRSILRSKHYPHESKKIKHKKSSYNRRSRQQS
jgi:hypothetical protein